MDYNRIYAEFIADRRLKEPTLTGYTERHHILPRSAGGTDLPDNLIDLTPEDHFFAHLCWAKAVDTMGAWSAVMVMHERDRRADIFKRKSRKRYGWARRRFGRWCSEERLGTSNPNHKAERVALKHLDGRTFALTRSEWRSGQGIEHAALCGVMTGKVRSYHGWMLPETDPVETGRAYAGRKKRTPTKYHWRHLNGEEMKATPFELAEAHGLRNGDVSSVARGEHAMCFGWSIVGRKSGWPSGRTHFRDERTHILVNVDGRKLSGDQRSLVGQGGLTQQDVSAIVSGARKSARGWMLKANVDAGHTPRAWTRRQPMQEVANANGPTNLRKARA